MKKILVAVPAYNCEKQIGRVVAQFDANARRHFDRVVVIDNGSSDGTLEAAQAAAAQNMAMPVDVCRNVENYNLGGTHKVAFRLAQEGGYDAVVIFHGDDQGRIQDIYPVLQEVNLDAVDCLMGARFMPGSSLTGYPRVRVMGNLIFNGIYSAAVRTKVWDMGSGLNLFTRRLIATGLHVRMPDDLTFNNCYLLACYAHERVVGFFPISWREEDQVSNARLFRQSRRLIGFLWSFLVSRRQFAARAFSLRHADSYRTNIIFSNTRAKEQA